jgi:hypothetical protein
MKRYKSKEQQRIKIRKRSAALENLDTGVDVNTALETIRILNFQPKTVSVVMNCRNISHGSMKDA